MPAERREQLNGSGCFMPGVEMNNPAGRIVVCIGRDCYRIEKTQANGRSAAVTEVPECAAPSAI